MEKNNTTPTTYPFGDIYRTYTLGGYSDQKYDFTGKERDVETGLHYYGARYYDRDLGRWLQVDPLADKYPGWSPYNYCVNNPVRMVDPDGRIVKFGSDSLQKMHDEFYNAKDEKGNFKNTVYRAQYDTLHRSDVVYNVVEGNLGTRGEVTSIGDFGTTDGKSVTITLNLAKGANIGEDLSHEFQHGIQFERGEIWFNRNEKSGKWSTANMVLNTEYTAFENQQVLPSWWNSDRLSKLRILYPDLKDQDLKTKGLTPLTNYAGKGREVLRWANLFGVAQASK